MTKMRSEARQFSRYGLIGLANNTVLYVVFVVLIFLGLSPVLSAGICYVLGVLLSYLLNRQWTFQSSNSHTRDLPRFVLAYGVGLLSTLGTISLLVLWLPPQIAQIFNILITAVVVYVMLRVLKFGTGQSDHAH